jgi:CO/xanthine dehydrogenase Mo-binding subunit
MRKRGQGISNIWHPTGYSGGGDGSTAWLKVNMDGSVDLFIGSVEIGQGVKTVMAQMVAEELGIPVVNINVINENSQVAPFDYGTAATRQTHNMGNAVVMAAREAREVILEIAASLLGCSSSEMEMGNNEIVMKTDPDTKLPFEAITMTANFSMGRIIAGRGGYIKPLSQKDEATGACDAWTTQAFNTVVADVEVDTDTGEVSVIRLISACDVGKAINPMLCEGQIEGGAVMGIGMALMENLHPFNPGIEFQPLSLHDYVIPTAMDTGAIISVILEKPSSTGPYGAKGFGEMTMNGPAAAIANAVYNAIGVRICQIPITPELVLRGLEEKDKELACKS